VAPRNDAGGEPAIKRESRRVGTRRLPYVGDRVGGLGVRPPALADIWRLKAFCARMLHMSSAVVGPIPAEMEPTAFPATESVAEMMLAPRPG
jgi:hypothetical protein